MGEALGEQVRALEVGPRHVVVVRMPDGGLLDFHRAEAMDALRELCDRTGCSGFVITGEVEVEALDEEQMRAAGWARIREEPE